MMRLVVVSLIALCATACDPSPQQQERDVCTSVCGCLSTLPSAVDACVSQCVAGLDDGDLRDSCIDCVYSYSQTCGDLFDRCIESNLCDLQQLQ